MRALILTVEPNPHYSYVVLREGRTAAEWAEVLDWSRRNLGVFRPDDGDNDEKLIRLKTYHDLILYKMRFE